MRTGGKRTIIALAIVLFAGAADSDAQTPHQATRGGFRVEAGTMFGVTIAGKEFDTGINATGGERLIAKVNHGGSFGLRIGVHNSLIGLEGNLLGASNLATVKSEFGVAFPNHAERPVFYSADALVFLAGRKISGGRVRPYLTTGAGGVFVSADLDNINDKERHNRFMWNAGGGVKLFVAGERGAFLDLRFTNHRLLGSRQESAADFRSVTVGFGYRF